ncbi:hypothetical protein L0F63_002756 [Massospora cicadina]|nr:hypothetical protein L0F63_002756 [Massospora cicadina]
MRFPIPLPFTAGPGLSLQVIFPLSKPARISELSNSSSGLYRRRTTRRQTRVSPSQLSYSVTSSCCNQTLSTTVAVPPSLSLAVRLSCENREAPLSAPLPGLLGSSRPFPTYTLRSNVPEVTIPSPLRLPPPISAGLNGARGIERRPFYPSVAMPPFSLSPRFTLSPVST